MMNKSIAQTMLRILLGLLMVIPGIGKIMNPPAVVGMLQGIGFPLASFWAWILILSEILFGAALVIGYKVKWTAWPPVIILVVALLTVHLKTLGDPMGTINVLFHLVAIAGLIVVATNGPGVCAVSKN